MNSNCDHMVVNLSGHNLSCFLVLSNQTRVRVTISSYTRFTCLDMHANVEVHNKTSSVRIMALIKDLTKVTLAQ